MEAPYTPGMEQQPFLFYNPGPHPSHGHHGHFTPHPHQLQQQPYHAPVHFHPEMMKPAHLPMHFHHPPAPPQYSMEPPVYMYHHAAYPHTQMLTPVASPQPIYPKPSIVIETQSPRFYSHEYESAPSTPPLSSSSSSVGSPTPRSLLPTPVNEPATYGFPDSMMGFKQGCEKEGLTLLATFDDLTSPQLRPGMHLFFLAQHHGFQPRTPAKNKFGSCQVCPKTNTRPH